MKKIMLILSVLTITGILTWVYLTRSPVVVMPTPAVEAAIAKTGTPPNCASDTIIASQLLTLTNIQRAKNGLANLTENATLDQAAMIKAQDEITRHYWGHHLPGESTWTAINKAGYNYRYVGENLAQDFATSDGVVNGWMGSPEHRVNILNVNYTEVGFAVVCGVTDHATTLIVAEYGTMIENPAIEAKAAPVTQVAQRAQATATPPTPVVHKPLPSLQPVVIEPAPVIAPAVAPPFVIPVTCHSVGDSTYTQCN